MIVGKDKISGIQGVLEIQHAGITGHAKNTALLNTRESRNLPILNCSQIVLIIHSQTKQIQIIHRAVNTAS